MLAGGPATVTSRLALRCLKILCNCSSWAAILLEVGRYLLSVLPASHAVPSSACWQRWARHSGAAGAEFSSFLMGGNEALNRSELLMVPVELGILGKCLCF